MKILKYILQAPLWILNIIILASTFYLYFTQDYPTKLFTPIILLIIDILYLIGRIMGRKKRNDKEIQDLQ